MRPADRAALAGAIRFTNAAGGLLLPAELDLPRALNIGELVEQIDRRIFLRDGLRVAGRRLWTSGDRRRIERDYRTRAETLSKRAAAVAEQVRDQHLAHVKLGLGIRRDAAVLVDRAFAGVICGEHFRQAQRRTVTARNSVLTQEIYKAHGAERVADRIERVVHAEAIGSRGHQLHQALRALGRDRAGIVARLDGRDSS